MGGELLLHHFDSLVPVKHVIMEMYIVDCDFVIINEVKLNKIVCSIGMHASGLMCSFESLNLS
jgi:hypothetical protein